MKSQIVKGFAVLMMVVGLTLVAAVGTAQGQTTIHVTSNVPFDFIVGDKTLPSGQYNLRSASLDGEIVQISGENESAFRLTNRLEPQRNKTNTRLVFHRYGARYFLAEIWMGGEAGRAVRKSKQESSIERELAKIDSRHDVAQKTYERVDIAAAQ